MRHNEIVEIGVRMRRKEKLIKRLRREAEGFYLGGVFKAAGWI